MSVSNAPYRPLLSEEEHSGEEDDAPPVVKHMTYNITKGVCVVTCYSTTCNLLHREQMESY